MNRVATFLIAALVVGFIADTAPAQIGRGRLLKKFRDDIFGPPVNKAQVAQEKALLAQQKLEASRKAQLEKQKRAATARQPTPIGTGSKASNQQTARGAQPTKTPRPPYRPTQPAPKTVSNRSNQAPKRGFGLLMVEKNEKLIVSQIDPNGNAAGKGFRPGDVITAIGGVEVDTTVAFDEIAEILSDGDSIEIAYQRGGKTEEVQVSYGEAPNPEESGGVAIEGSVEPSGTLARTQRTADFAPPRQAVSSQQSSRNQRPTFGAATRPRSPSQVEQLNSVVRQQSQKIQSLENELRALRQQRGSVPGTAQVPSRRVNSVLDPVLN